MGDTLSSTSLAGEDIVTASSESSSSPHGRSGLTTLAKTPHDGDTCTYNVVMADESNKASVTYLNSLQAFVDPRGGLRASVSTTTSELVMRSMTA